MEHFSKIEDERSMMQIVSLENGGHLICQSCKQEHEDCEYAPAYGMIMCPKCRWGDSGRPQKSKRKR